MEGATCILPRKNHDSEDAWKKAKREMELLAREVEKLEDELHVIFNEWLYSWIDSNLIDPCDDEQDDN